MIPWLDDGDVQLHHGDVIQTLRELPAGIAQTCVTSPPYWGLRDYSADGQLGLEATPDLYVERLVAVFREVWRVLRADGTVWLNLGDSYVAAGGGGESRMIELGNPTPDPYFKHAARGKGLQSGNTPPSRVGLPSKNLVGIPWKVAFALQADGWYLRSDIVWSKPNPMPESVVDRPTKAHEYLFLLVKRPRYFYDADAIREPHARLWDESNGGNLSPDGAHKANGSYRERGGSYPEPNPAGRNRRSVWTIATEPFPEAHFATYPQALVRPCIQAGTSERGECSSCGAPWRRVAETKIDTNRPAARRNIIEPQVTQNGQGTNARGSSTWGHWTTRETTGWEPTCSCKEPGGDVASGRSRGSTPVGCIPQLVLDPFVGSGTTALVARNHGRRCIGIDLSAEYLAIAAKRLQQLSLLGELA